ncbi:diguanylate cyclase [Mycetocola lacteus]|uniref:Diguanylate cyclase n=1 Tax=Mycetocola lacteus TaxID=76637 RepID=A0A3L7AGS0_9MICO|nr:diguanylate cyclase [Mycetocola lacteus]RLP78888.1 diguanylate cyclase [Mycetocola lacteus]
MNFDAATLQLVNGLMAIICAVPFVLHTVFRGHDRAGLYWSLGFMSGLVSAGCYAVSATLNDGWVILAVANGAFALTLGAVWSGTRLFNGRRSLIQIPILAGLVCAALVPVFWAEYGTWAGAAGYMVTVGIFAGLIGWEALRPPLRRNVYARVFATAMILGGLYQLDRALELTATGVKTIEASPLYGSATATLVVTVLLVISSICLTAIRAERDTQHRLAPTPGGGAVNFSMDVLSAPAFAAGAKDRMVRSRQHGIRVALLQPRIDGLSDFQVAYGASAAQEAILRFVGVLRGSVPPTAIIGHLGEGHFAVLAMMDEVTSGRDVARGILTTLAETPLAPERGLRMSASVGVAEQSEPGVEWDILWGAVNERLAAARADAGNVIAEVRVARDGSRVDALGHKLAS